MEVAAPGSFGLLGEREAMLVVIDRIEKEENDTLLGITMSGLGEPVMHVSWEEIKTGHFVHR